MRKSGPNFDKLPIMNKREMMDHFDDMVCVDLTKEQAFELAYAAEQSRDFSDKKDRISVGLSSGTSNHRGIFLASQKEADIWTGSILARLLPDLKGYKSIAFFS